ncbi:Hypothetical predicted protein [Podarcis lilfordi]|uniref:Uncharacterized protein n=1 Tax=Podarcis lilfordi TaxID=74358 RepID=A0AA35L126_9SAUR|nr:Hypothetical predicted protein [Podarcis lilfordi]
MKLHSVSDEEQPPVYVPGISTERNFRARYLLKGQKVEVKAKVPVAAAPAPMDAWKSAGQAPGQQIPRNRRKSANSAAVEHNYGEHSRRMSTTEFFRFETRLHTAVLM